METETKNQRWMRLNPEKVKQSRRESYQRHKEKRKAEALQRYYRRMRGTEQQREIWRAAGARWKEKNKDRIREYARKNSVRYLYGLSFERYEAIVREQGGLCAVCGKPPQGRRLDVDHDHASGNVRELLCSRCNRLIAAVEKSDSDILERVGRYLAKHKRSAAPFVRDC
jgi:Recombination endonuclease VII